MNSQAELIAILHRLLSVEIDGDPTIAGIETVVPNLRQLDWVNRFGPANAWMQIASGLRTDQLKRLVKIFVVAEREYDWLGGSVAATIWLFREYSARAVADADALADWVLRNRGRNLWIPFGRMTWARSLSEWRVEEERRALWREIQQFREQEQKEAKARRAREARERSEARKEASAARHKNLQACLEKLQTLTGSERLKYIARSSNLPLEFIPEDRIGECVAVAASLDGETKHVLVERIGRRRRKIWKDLRAALVR